MKKYEKDEFSDMRNVAGEIKGAGFIMQYCVNHNIKKINIEEFIDFCIKNNKHILKLGNVLKLEREEEIEVI